VYVVAMNELFFCGEEERDGAVKKYHRDRICDFF
jgi:hypothetical protein